MKYILPFEKISSKDTALVGGKNSSLGEMVSSLKKFKIFFPDGFSITSKAYIKFIKENNLQKKIESLLKEKNIEKAGSSIRALILNSKIPKEIEKEVYLAYEILLKKQKNRKITTAVRSSATAEDLPKASFAGQLDSFLNVKKENLISFVIKCYSSLFTNRAISYCKEKKINHAKIYLSVGIQKMVRADKASSGVIFTLDTETGFRKTITITSGFGLGENIVQGKIIPDEYLIFKPFLNKKNIDPIIEKKLGKKSFKLIYSKGNNNTKNIKTTYKEQNSFVLTDKEILTLARWAYIIEDHYKKPMDIEWAKDGIEKKIYIVQARPETVKSKIKISIFKNFQLKEKAKPIISGIAIGEEITSSKVQIINSIKEIKKFKKDYILVTKTTSPDWVCIMKKAKGIITDLGGRTSHAAIVSRELNIPAIVGTNNATSILRQEQKITLNCSQGNIGYIYNGFLKYNSSSVDISKLPKIKTPIMINISSPEASFKWWQLPIKGIGLARMEFIISNLIKIHPMALLYPQKVKDKNERNKIEKLTKNYKDKKEYFIDILSRNISKIAASQFPNPTIVRLSDFKTNEYANLIGGKYFESFEENPMIGFRGASRYYHEKYKKAFMLECLAIKKAREHFGFSNIIIMVPFLRTLKEADKILKLLEENGLKKTKNLKIYMMAEIPSNVILIEKFAEKFDGFSIGSNDLTQLILGIDRDSSLLAEIFDPKDEAVKKAIKNLIEKAHKKKKKVGICGQAPSDFPEFAKFLIDQKIDSISLNPSSVEKVIKTLAKFHKS